jgi:hypothetical protein
MGRPIKEKYFGNRNTPYSNQAVGGTTGLGGEGVASITLSTSSLTVSTGTVTVLFSAPQIPGGVTASGTPVKTGNTVTSVTINTAGTGYTAAPTVVFAATVGTTGTGVAVLTTTLQNAIKGLAFVPGGSAKLFDIKKQEGSKRYLVNTADGRAICKLVASPTIASGEMNIIASDTNGSTYFVKKLTARRAVLVQSTATGSFLFADGAAAGWTLGSAAAGIVSVSNN